MESWTQLGVAGLTLGILFFIVRYFVQALNRKDELNQSLTERFIEISEKNIQSHQELTKSINASTEANKLVADVAKEGNDKLTTLMLKVIKNSGNKK